MSDFGYRIFIRLDSNGRLANLWGSPQGISPADSHEDAMTPAFRQSPGRTRRRRSHQAIKAVHTVLCPNCGTAKRPHTACTGCGYVRPGLQVKTSRAGQ